MRFAVFILAGFLAADAAASPCSGVESPIPAKVWPRWAAVLAKHLDVREVRPIAYLHAGQWSIVEVSTSRSNDVLVSFPASDPAAAPSVGPMWDAAQPPEKKEGARKWALEKMPGVAASLADCFAFRVNSRK